MTDANGLRRLWQLIEHPPTPDLDRRVAQLIAEAEHLHGPEVVAAVLAEVAP